jgi:hypothetical protein
MTSWTFTMINPVAAAPSTDTGSGVPTRWSHYRFVLRRPLSEQAAEAAAGVGLEPAGDSILTGCFGSQAHLLSILRHLRGLGVRPVSVYAIQ